MITREDMEQENREATARMEAQLKRDFGSMVVMPRWMKEGGTRESR